MSFERHGVSWQRQFNCLFNHLVRLTSKTASKFSITGPSWVEYIQQFPHKGSVLEWRQISVMSNHRRLDYSFNSLPRLITKEKSKLWISGSLWGESGDRWIPLGKSRQFKKRYRAYWQHVNNDSINHFGILTHWEFLVQVLRIRMARLHIERNKSRRKFVNKSRVDTDLRHDRSCNVIAMIHNVWNSALS